MSELAAELAAAGGVGAPPSATARLREALLASLEHGAGELARARSGYGGRPVTVVVAAEGGHLLAATPASPALRVDPEAASERAWLLVAAVVGLLVDLAEPGPPVAGEALALHAGALADGFLVLGHPAPPPDAVTLDELVPLLFADHVEDVDRLRARAVAGPAALLADTLPTLRPPIGPGHPLRVAEIVARLGGRPADPRSVEAHEERVYGVLEPGGAHVVRPHEDPDPARRVARRILQRLDGMGKWGGYHTDIAHLARGFAGHERALALEVGEALLAAELLSEKPSVGQRHVYLNPRRAAAIHRLVETGEAPRELRLPTG